MSGLVFDNNSNTVLGYHIAQKNITGNRTTGNTVLNATVQGVKDRATLEAAVQAANGTLYTNAFLQSQTNNDLIYALRFYSDPNNLLVG